MSINTHELKDPVNRGPDGTFPFGYAIVSGSSLDLNITDAWVTMRGEGCAVRTARTSGHMFKWLRKLRGDALIWISVPLISEEATVVGHRDIGTPQSDRPAPFIKSNGFKTRTAWGGTKINWDAESELLFSSQYPPLAHSFPQTQWGIRFHATCWTH